jgi:hypothetical protein
VPEEQFDDGPLVKFDVEEIQAPPPTTTPPPPKPFPWWIVAVIGAVVVLLLIAGGVWFFFLRQQPLTGNDVRILSAQPAANTTLHPSGATVLQYRIQYSLAAPVTQAYVIVSMADFPNASTCTGTPNGNGFGYQAVDGSTGEVTVSLAWTNGSVGRTAPWISLYDISGGSTIRQFESPRRLVLPTPTRLRARPGENRFR